MPTRPTFCANEVMGMQPNRPDTVDITPSPAMEPATSRSVGVRLRPTMASAVVSPTTSVAETT